MRARLPDRAGHVERDGVRIGYEVFGQGDPSILLLPTWTIIHSRFWKMQVPYLSRHYRVVTYDGPGNGRSDRVTDPGRYEPASYARDAAAVLDSCGVDSFVAIGLSRGAAYALALARLVPERVLGLVLIGAALPIAPPPPARAGIPEEFDKPYPESPQGWDKYNLAYWHDHYPDFVEFFFTGCFSEPHSTKPIEDSVGWALETTPSVLEAEAVDPEPEPDWMALLRNLRCPTMVIHGTGDRISAYERGRLAAEFSNGTLLTMEGSGHIPNVRDPVKVNLAIYEFVRTVTR
jgi:pimeloyl-ACP methyl ester carboxylesterase